MTTPGQLDQRFAFDCHAVGNPDAGSGEPDYGNPAGSDYGNTEGGFEEQFVVWTRRQFLRGSEPLMPARNDFEVDKTIPAPTGVTAVAAQVAGTVVIKVSWNALSRDTLLAQVRYRKHGSIADWAQITAPAGEVTQNLVGLEDNTTYDVQARAVTPVGKASKWVPNSGGDETIPTLFVNVVLDPTPPAAPASLQAVVSVPNVTLSGRANNDNTRSLTFRRSTSAQVFADSVQVGPTYRCSPNQLVDHTDTPGYGHWKYWVTAKNGSDVPAAAPLGPLAVDVLGPELVTNGAFAANTDWTKGTGWTIASGVASKAAGAAANLTQAIALTAGQSFEVTYTVTALSAGTVTRRDRETLSSTACRWEWPV